MNDVTRLLDQLQQGDRRAAAQLLLLMYNELRKQAHHLKPPQPTKPFADSILIA